MTADVHKGGRAGAFLAVVFEVVPVLVCLLVLFLLERSEVVRDPLCARVAEDVNREQHQIASANRHPISTGTKYGTSRGRMGRHSAEKHANDGPKLCQSCRT